MENLKLKNQLCFPLWLCAKEITQAYEPMLSALDLTYTQYVAMMFFWENDGASCSDLSDALYLKSSTTTPVIERLVQKGYLTKRQAKDDARRQIINVTPKGNELKYQAVRIPEKIGSCVDLKPEEAATLYRLLYKVIDNIEKEKYEHRNRD